MTSNHAMRDVLLGQLYRHMSCRKDIVIVSADFGSRVLDDIRRDFPSRFFNVGIAEQNMVNVSTGLALEGFTVFAYAIAAFASMRAYEQIRSNLSLQSQQRPLNVNLVAVGAGFSYDISGPSHHCLEDLSAIRTLPNIAFFSPSDSILVKAFTEYCLEVKKPKYLRLDSKPLRDIYSEKIKIDLEKGFSVLQKGERVCLVATGFMTHVALSAAAKIASQAGWSPGIVDIYLLKPLDENALLKEMSHYQTIISLEEGFIGKGGLDSLVALICSKIINKRIKVKSIGLPDVYSCQTGNRLFLHKLNHIDEESIIEKIIRP